MNKYVRVSFPKISFLLIFILMVEHGCTPSIPGMTDQEILASTDTIGGQNAKYSPDGKWILYMTVVDTKRAIWKMRTDGAGKDKLYEYDGYMCCANFSRDGDLISFNIGDPDLDIWIMNSDGSSARAITENNLHDGGPGWTYDNRLVFTSVHEGKFELAGIYTIAPDGTHKTRLHSLDFRAFDPSWSHDNRFVLAQHVDDGNLDIYKIDTNSGGYSRLTNSDSADWYPAWSNDDKLITYRNNESGNWDIYTIRPDGTQKRRLTDPSSEDRSPTFSPDGTKIAYQSRELDEEVFDIWLMNFDGSGKLNLTNDPFDNQGAMWSPDGQSLIYTAKIEGRSHVMTIMKNGNGKRLMTRK